MIYNLLDIHVQEATICQEIHVIEITPHKRIIIVMVDGHCLDQHVRLVIQRPVTHITIVHQVVL